MFHIDVEPQRTIDMEESRRILLGSDTEEKAEESRSEGEAGVQEEEEEEEGIDKERAVHRYRSGFVLFVQVLFA